MQVHIFIGQFKDRDEATLYTEEQCEPEPDESASDEEYTAWEDRNPVWKMEEDLGCYLDHDYIETIMGEDSFEYLKSLLKDPELANPFEQELQSDSAALILIFDKAISPKDAAMKSTPRMEYKGRFESNIG